MRDKVKRFISILMTALMLVNLLPVGALAEGVTIISNSFQTKKSEWQEIDDPTRLDNKNVYVYVEIYDANAVQKELIGNLLQLNKSGFYTIGKKGITMPGTVYRKSDFWGPEYKIVPAVDNNVTYSPGYSPDNKTTLPAVSSVIYSLDNTKTANSMIPLKKVTEWKYKLTTGADEYVENTNIGAWHLDGKISINDIYFPYKVEHIVSGTGEVLGTDIVTEAVIGTNVTATAKEDGYFPGYKWDGKTIETKQITGRTETVIHVYYVPDGSRIQANYGAEDGGKVDNKKDDVLKKTGYVVRGSTVLPDDKIVSNATVTKNGYKFMGWVTTNNEGKRVLITEKNGLTAEDVRNHLRGTAGAYQNTTYHALFAKESDIQYTVKHYKIDGNKEPKLYKKETKEVTAEQYAAGKVTAESAIIEIPGYSYSYCNPDSIGVPIKKGKDVLNLYYTRNSYDYTVHYYWNGQPIEKVQTGTLNTGDTKEVWPKEIEGYTPVSSEKKTITEGNKVITFNYYKNVELTAKSGTATYDGNEHSVSGFTSKTVKEGDPVTLSFNNVNVPEVTKKDADTYPVMFNKNPVDEVDTTGKYIVTKATDGSLTISPRSVTLTSGSAERVYNGEALTNGTVTAEGFVKDEGATYNVTGSQTEVGESANEFTYTLNEGTLAGNYTITPEYGTLKVNPVTDEVIVTITGKTGSHTYDGDSHTVTGYEVTNISNTLYKQSDIKFNGTAKAEGTDAGTYKMWLTDKDFENTSKNFSKVTFKVTDGSLTISPRSVTLTSGSAERVYNGEALTKDEVTASTGENEGFVGNEGATYDVTGSQTEVGESKNTFSYTLKDGTNAKNYNIELALGTLKVTPVTDKVTVTITENSGTEKYDGTEKTVTGYTVSISNPLYKESDFTFGGNAEVKGTNAGTYDMELKPEDFTNNNTNFAEVKFVIVDGSLTISPRSVKLTSASASKTYDGKPLANDTVAVGGDGFVKDEGATYKVTGSQTLVGSSDNTFTYTLNEGTKATNYNIELALGKLEVKPVTEEVIVTITGRTAEMPYDGKEHSVFGYDLTVSNALYNPKEDMQFNGIDGDMTAKGTDAGTYPMELTAEHFTNKSKNFSKVTFVVTDGYVKINPRAVTLTSETAGKTYDGTALEKPVVTVGGDGFVEGQVKEIKATGSVTNAGSVANTITFTPVEEKFNEKNYNIQKTEGTLTIVKRSVLITSQSATKTYDGSALTRPAVTITGDGFVPGELAKAEATGSITNVGSTPNAIQYTTTGAFNAANYSIALSVGTLTVTERPQPEPRRTFNLTISYVYQNGKRAAASYNRGGLKNGETFDITSPVIAGYTASETVVSGTIYNRDIKVTVIYTADGVNLDDYGVPLGLGNITMNVGDCFE